MMCVGLADRVAEELVFGEMACTTGAEQDYKQVTAEAARFIRHHGFGTRLSRTDVTVELDNHLNTDVEPSNAAIEELLQSQYQRASALLGQYRGALTRLVEALLDHGMIAQPEMQALMAQSGVAIAVAAHTGPDEALILEPFAARLAAFRQQTGGQAASAPDSESPACL